jgi:tetratricopeptide (TPR) repeat protein
MEKPMAVTVLRGFEPALIAHFAAVARPPGALWLAGAPPRDGKNSKAVSLGATRRLLGQIRRHLGEIRTEEILARHAPAAALLLPGRRERLAPEERAGVEALRARLTSHMTHNFVLQHPIFDAWAGLFVDLLEAGPFMLVAPSQALLSWEDGAILKSLYRRFPERAPDLVLGFDPGFRHQEDEDGIVWTMSSYHSLALALDLQGLQEGEPVDLPDPGSRTTWGEVLGLEIEEEDLDDLEAQARIRLADPAPLSEDEVSRIAAAQRACFESFAFTSALRLGLDLLERDPRLAPAQVAEVHGIVALAAHNRQFLTQSPGLVRFLDRHLAAALAAETRPAHRCALLYRLAVVHGRRRKDAETALGWADRGVEAARHPALFPFDAAYQGAWARNIRAYVLMRLGRLEEAETETIAGCERLEPLVAALPGQGERGRELDLRASHSLLAFNTRTLLQLLDRDDAQLTAWLERSRNVLRPVPAVVRFDGFHWAELYGRRMLRPDLALPIVLRGIEDARKEVDTVRGYELALIAADLCERVGNTEQARELYAQIQGFRRRCGLPRLPAIDVAWALACQREGRLDEARSRIDETAADPAHASREAQAELLACRARIEAEAGDGAAVEHLLEEAADVAIESGDRDALLRVAIATGRCHQILGRVEEAREAYEQALEIADAEVAGEPGGPGGPGGQPPAAVDRLLALLGAWETGLEEPRDLAPRTVRTASEALDSAEAWRELPRLMKLLHGSSGRLLGEDLREAWKRVRTAAGQPSSPD